jgi:hypothetical protein
VALVQVEELLHDQQHQIELLVKGNFSLRGSMSGLRRNSKEIESRSRQLQDELEQQHQAALRQALFNKWIQPVLYPASHYAASCCQFLVCLLACLFACLLLAKICCSLHAQASPIGRVIVCLCRQMETKLEMAIQQVQLLQQANRERQQQQEANAQLALSAATWEVQSLKTRLDDLQVCCCTVPSTVLDEC